MCSSSWVLHVFFFFKQKTAYEMRISDWSSDVCSSDLFETSEVRFVLGASGEVVQAGMLPRNDAHRLIEECMIAANVEAARFLLKKAIPAPYRVHDRPPESKYAELQEFLAE